MKKRKIRQVVGCKRITYRPSVKTLRKRCVRAIEREGFTLIGRKDIEYYIRALKLKLFSKSRKKGGAERAIIYREAQLDEYDFGYGKVRAKSRMRTLGFNQGSFEKNIAQLIYKLRCGEKVKGFDLVPTKKVKSHPALIHVMDLEDGITLCVQLKQVKK